MNVRRKSHAHSSLPPQDANSLATAGGFTTASFTRDSTTQLTIQFHDMASGRYLRSLHWFAGG